MFDTMAAAKSVRDAARGVLLEEQKEKEDYLAAEESKGNIKKTNIVGGALTALTSWFGKKKEVSSIDLGPRQQEPSLYGGGYAGADLHPRQEEQSPVGGGAASAFGGGGAASASELQPQEFSVWMFMEALDGKPLEVAVFGGQKSGKTQATGALLSSLQPLMNFQKIFYGLGAGSDYDSIDNGTLRKFVHKDQVVVISSSADIGDLIDRAVSTNEKKVVVVDDIMQHMEGNATRNIGILCSMGRKSQTSFFGIFHANIGGRQKAVVLNGLTVIVVCEAMFDLLEQRTLIPKDQVELMRGWMKQITKEKKLLFLPSPVEIKTAFWLRGSEMHQQFLVEPEEGPPIVNRAPAPGKRPARFNALSSSSSEETVNRAPAPPVQMDGGRAPGKRPARKPFVLSSSSSSEEEEEGAVLCKDPKPKVVRKRTLKKSFNLEKELDCIVGMEPAKDKLREMEANIKSRVQLEAKGICLGTATKNHIVIVGNPGSGKTSMARLISIMLYEVGATERNVFVEALRSDLVGEHVGQTAIKTKQLILKAEGGVCFVDESYQLCNASENDYGTEALEEIMRHMIDGNIVFIFAGYPHQMQQFLNMNAGLKRRIGWNFLCTDLTCDDLAQVLAIKIAGEQHVRLAEDVDMFYLEDVFRNCTSARMRSEQNGTGGAAGATGNNFFFGGSSKGGGKKRKKGGRSQRGADDKAKIKEIYYLFLLRVYWKE
eukprot:gene8795-32691_t